MLGGIQSSNSLSSNYHIIKKKTNVKFVMLVNNLVAQNGIYPDLTNVPAQIGTYLI